MKRIIFIVLAVAVSALVYGQKVGDLAPDFTLQKTNGSDYKLSDQRGKVVLLFFLGDKCSSCRAIAPSVQSNIVDVFGENNMFTAIGIDTWNGSNSSVNNFKTSTGINFDILTKGSTVANQWSISYDRLAVVDDKGTLVFKGQGLASSHLNQAKEAVSTALGNITASNPDIVDAKGSLKVFPTLLKSTGNISFHNEKEAMVDISLISIAGNKVKTVVREYFGIGSHQVSFDRGNLPSGLYLMQLTANGKKSTQRVILD